MPVSRKLLLLLSASLLAPPIACRSSKGPQQGMSRTMEAPMGRAEPSPMADTSPTPTAAEAIATRARQDLLDSMAIGTNAGGGMVAPNDLQETTVVTWTDPLAAQSGPTNPAEASAPVSSPGTTLIGTDEVSAPSTDITQLTNALAHALHDRSHDGRLYCPICA